MQEMEIEEEEDDMIAQPHEIQHLQALMGCGVAAFRMHCASAVRGKDLDAAVEDAVFRERVQHARIICNAGSLLPSIEDELWPFVESNGAPPFPTLPLQSRRVSGALVHETSGRRC